MTFSKSSRLINNFKVTLRFPTWSNDKNAISTYSYNYTGKRYEFLHRLPLPCRLLIHSDIHLYPIISYIHLYAHLSAHNNTDFMRKSLQVLANIQSVLVSDIARKKSNMNINIRMAKCFLSNWSRRHFWVGMYSLYSGFYLKNKLLN